MNEYMISVTELAYAILFLLSVVLGIYLIAMVRNANEAFKNLKRVLSDNQEHVRATLKNVSGITSDVRKITEESSRVIEASAPRVPVIVEDVGTITKSVKESVKKVGRTVESVGEGVVQTTDVLKSNAGDIISYFKIITDIIKTVIHMFSKK